MYFSTNNGPCTFGNYTCLLYQLGSDTERHIKQGHLIYGFGFLMIFTPSNDLRSAGLDDD